LKSTPGVYLKRSKIADTTTSVAVRGFNGSGKNLIMWNGMPLNDSYSASPNWGSNSMGATDRIEVVRGPFSSLYGRNAMGGVVNIISKTPMKQEAEIKTGYGSDNTYTGYASYGVRYRDCFSIFLSYDYLSTDGTRNQLVTVKQPATTGTGTTAVTGGKSSTNSSGEKVYIIGDTGKNCFDQQVATGGMSWDITKNQKLDYSFKIGKYVYGYKDPKSYLVDASGHSFTGTAGSSTSTVTISDDGSTYKATVTPKTFLAGGGERESILNVLNYSIKKEKVTIAAKLGSNSTSNQYASVSTWSDFSGGAGTLNSTNPARTLYEDVQANINVTEHGILT
ncbi:MAG: TonB-dependent receptor, partial [Spirochaetota bacterium]